MTQAMNMAEALRRIVESQSVEMHVALPGIVKSYDASTQTADIELALTRPLPSPDEEENEDEYEALPILPSVPVAWPRAGGFYLHFPMTEGDSVLVVFNELDINSWRNSGSVSDPAVSTRHALSGAVAVPGLYPRTNTNPSADGSNATLGAEGGLTVTLTSGEMQVDGSGDAAALASEVDDQLNNLKTVFNGWTPSPNDGGAALKAALSSWISDMSASASSVLKVGS